AEHQDRHGPGHADLFGRRQRGGGDRSAASEQGRARGRAGDDGGAARRGRGDPPLRGRGDRDQEGEGSGGERQAGGRARARGERGHKEGRQVGRVGGFQI